MIIKKIAEGIRPIDGEYLCDMTKDEATDIINTVVSSDLHFSNFADNAYWFGYTFTESSSKGERTKFIEWLKNQKELTSNLSEFIIRPYVRLLRQKELGDISLVICPKSERSRLVSLMIKSLQGVLPHGLHWDYIEAIKNLPSEISVDLDALRIDCDSDKQFIDRKKFIEDTLLPKIKDLSYFSLAKNVKVKYRPFIQNYLKFEENDILTIKSIQNGNILLVDDINTSGSTLKEMLRIVHKINPDCKIFIYTLIGKQ